MKLHQSMTVGIGINLITNARRKGRNVVTMVAILMLGLMLRSSPDAAALGSTCRCAS